MRGIDGNINNLKETAASPFVAAASEKALSPARDRR